MSVVFIHTKKIFTFTVIFNHIDFFYKFNISCFEKLNHNSAF